METQKTIKITPSFFSMGKGKKGRTLKKKQDVSGSNHQVNTNKLKKKFIQHIKDLRNKKHMFKSQDENTIDMTKPSNEKENQSGPNDDFKSSLNFMKSIISPGITPIPTKPPISNKLQDSPRNLSTNNILKSST